MSSFSEEQSKKFSRRNFIQATTTLAGFCLLNCDALAGNSEYVKINRALDDENIIQGKVSFKSGDGDIEAYLARPGKPGRYPVVIVVGGNTFDEEYIRDLTAKYAQKDFIGISPNIYSLQKDTMTPEEKRKVFVEQITDEGIFRDLQASIDYLNKQEFVKKDRVGITEFCFGGRCALMFAAHSKEIDAVAPFYGNLRTPPFANRKEDPLDVLNKIKVPVQGHYSENDTEIPLDQLKSFEESLKKQGTDTEIFTYNAPHGFFAYTRKSYNAEAAQLSWQRTSDFFKRVLGD